MNCLANLRAQLLEDGTAHAAQVDAIDREEPRLDERGPRGVSDTSRSALSTDEIG
jgi:hypothetical protein